MAGDSQASMIHPFYDLRLLARLTRIIAETDPLKPPHWRRVAPPDVPVPRRLALLAGSFNPPTTAHLALGEAALTAGGRDEVALTISRVTVDKEAVTRASLTDRLLLLQLIVTDLKGPAPAGAVAGPYSAAIVNRGLFADQAEAVWAALPHLEDLAFVVGFDKIVQVFDARYYDDRDAALGRLFERASFLVAGRGSHAAADLDALLGQPGNRRYKHGVHYLPLSLTYAAYSSTAVRGGELSAAAGPYVPPLVAAFLAETHPYDVPVPRPDGSRRDPYGERVALLESLLARQSTLSPQAVRRLYHDALRG